MKLFASLASVSMLVAAGCAGAGETAAAPAAQSANPVDRITEIAAATCGSQNQIQSISRDGFVYKDDED